MFDTNQTIASTAVNLTSQNYFAGGAHTRVSHNMRVFDWHDDVPGVMLPDVDGDFHDFKAFVAENGLIYGAVELEEDKIRLVDVSNMQQWTFRDFEEALIFASTLNLH